MKNRKIIKETVENKVVRLVQSFFVEESNKKKRRNNIRN